MIAISKLMKSMISKRSKVSLIDIVIIFFGFCSCLFPIFVLIVPKYTQTACETVEEGYLNYFDKEMDPAYLVPGNENTLSILNKNCPNLII